MSLWEFSRNFLSPIALGTMMFGMGLGLTPADFKRVIVVPRAVAIGLGGQLVMLPLIAFIFTLIVPMEAALAVGLIIIAACPGGISSNAIVFAIRADLALSVTLTAVASLVTVFTIPLIISLGIAIHMPGDEAPALDVVTTIRRLFMMTVVPISLGMTVRALAPDLAARSLRFFRPAAVVLIVIIILAAVYGNFDFIRETIWTAVPVTLALSILALALGFALARLFRLPGQQVKTITIEIGVQNIAIAVFVTWTLMNNQNLAVVPIVYGLIAFTNAALFLSWMRSRERRRTGNGGAS